VTGLLSRLFLRRPKCFRFKARALLGLFEARQLAGRRAPFPKPRLSWRNHSGRPNDPRAIED
jgi:hypothetical protein